MKLEVGMYVRSNLGIAKITTKHKSRIGNEFLLDKEIIDTHEDYYTNCMYDYKFYLEQIIKTSHNIIDLIEIGDYVNGYKITTINDMTPIIYAEDEKGYLIKIIPEAEIETIVTREQFEAMQYKVVEEC